MAVAFRQGQVREDRAVVPALQAAGEMSASVLKGGPEDTLAIPQTYSPGKCDFIQYSLQRLITAVTFSLECLLPAIQ